MSEEHTSSSEHIMALPENWCWTQAGKVCSSVRDGTHDTPKYVDDGIPLVTSKNLLRDGLNLTNTKMISAEDHEQISRRSAVENGDILFAMIGTVGNPVLVNTPVEFSIKNVGIFKKNPAGVMPTYFKYWLESKAFSNWLAPRLKGTTQKFAPLSLLRNLPVPLSPLNEQERIVEKLEQLLSDLDKAVDSLKAAQEKLKTYRRAVLKAAVEGELSRVWREENKERLEPADKLLERILAERRRKWEEAELEKMRVKGKVPRDNGWKASYKEPNTPELRDENLVPEGWAYTCLGQAFNVYVGATPSRKVDNYWNGNIPWVSSGEVAFCRITDTKERITQAGLSNTSTTVHPVGTVMLGMIGEGKTRGQTAILDIEASHNQNTAAIRVSETLVSPEYIYYLLEKQYLETRSIGSGNNQPALNKSIVQSMPFSLPPVDEQRYIVEAVEAVLSVEEKLQAELRAQLLRSNSLRQSILQKAFSGQLVPQDPDDEPASVLLERIQAERAAQEVGGKRGKKKTADEAQPRLLEVDA